VKFVQTDFATDEGLAKVEEVLGNTSVELVVSDMAPNLSGIETVDQARSVHLAELAFEFACQCLEPGGDFAVKVFQGSGLDAFAKTVGGRFGKVYVRKPKASRDRSREVFLVAKDFRGG
jgi:23S rRNA (uridine2552-2'-O)-methyltransferase